MKDFRISSKPFATLCSESRPYRTHAGSYDTNPTKSAFEEFKIKTRLFNLIIEKLTYNTYVLLVFPPGEAELECARLNVIAAREEFARIDQIAESAETYEYHDRV